MTSKNTPFRAHSLLIVLITAGFLGACSRDDFPEKIVKPVIVASAPSTMGFIPAEVQEKSAGANDLTTIATNDPAIKKILAALQADDDKTLNEIAAVDDRQYVFCPSIYCAGAGFEYSKETDRAIA